eukprot:4007361-Amphidinium_carterae.1
MGQQVDNKETRDTPPDLDKEQSDKITDLTMKEEMDNQPDGTAVHIPPPPGLAMPMPMDVDNAIPHPEVGKPATALWGE